MYALCDCNNFFVSCERIFRPDLHDKPVVVLSCNDGCAVARSNEVKALGVPMGAPYFKYKALFQQHQVQCFSSNFSLYGDISKRVMATLQTCWPETTMYSVDEAFLDLRRLPASDHAGFADSLRETVATWVGIPVSIGVAPTKTLAKLAGTAAKKSARGVHLLHDLGCPSSIELMNSVDVGAVWGVGRQLAPKLQGLGIYSAGDLKRADMRMITKRFGVSLARVVTELRGTNTTDRPPKPQQQILVSRSFGHMVTDFDDVLASVARHVSSGGERLRRLDAVATKLTVFARTNRFRKDQPQLRLMASLPLPYPTADSRVLTVHARQLLASAFEPGYRYKKTGILLSDLIHLDNDDAPHDWQDDMWDPEPVASPSVMRAIDALTDQYGDRVIAPATVALSSKWTPRQSGRSPRYSTHWEELAEVRAGN